MVVLMIIGVMAAAIVMKRGEKKKKKKKKKWVKKNETRGDVGNMRGEALSPSLALHK